MSRNQRAIFYFGVGWFLNFFVFFLLGCKGVGKNHLSTYPACEGYGEPSQSKYVLPFPPKNFSTVLQSNCTNDSHRGPWRYGYDFKIPVGEYVYAARAGTVIKVKQDVDVNDQSGINYIYIRHPDNSIGRYMRLKKDSSLVQVDNLVTQGQQLAQVGKTDGAPFSHLHFDVVSGSDTNQTLVISFKNAAGSTAEPLKQNTEYEAQPYTPNVD